jgi:GR25 family glycosyltransferase involved in LPS biosynthesis
MSGCLCFWRRQPPGAEQEETRFHPQGRRLEHAGIRTKKKGLETIQALTMGVGAATGDIPLLKGPHRHRDLRCLLAFMIRHGRPFVPGEAGCHDSHDSAWQHCVGLDPPVVVLEDDFLLAPDAAERPAIRRG